MKPLPEPADQIPTNRRNTILSQNIADQLQPERYQWSSLPPWYWPPEAWARYFNDNPKPAKRRDPLAGLEAVFSSLTAIGTDYSHKVRNQTQDWIITTLFDNPWTRYWLGSTTSSKKGKIEQVKRSPEGVIGGGQADKGGFAEAVIRIIIAVAGPDRILDKQQLESVRQTISRNKRYQHLTSSALKKIVRSQAYILSSGTNLALNGLAMMLTDHKERSEALDIALKITGIHSQEDIAEYKVLSTIRKILGLRDGRDRKEDSNSLYFQDHLLQNISLS